MLVPQTFVSVSWGYVAMLAAQLLLTALFLAATVARTRASRLQILKGSSLATMCGLDRDARKALGGIYDPDTLDRAARDVRVRLERGSSGVALWLRRADGARPTTWQPVPDWRQEVRE